MIMIPIDLNFVVPNWGMPRPMAIQSSTPLSNIQSIVYQGKAYRETGEIWKVTVDSMNEADYIAGMQVRIASTTNFNGDWRITKVDAANNFLLIRTDGMDKDKAQTSAAGTAIPYGVIRDTNMKFLDTVPVLNNIEEILGYQYTDDCTYVIQLDNREDAQSFQLINLHSSVVCSMTAKLSIDKIHWVDFPTAISSGSIAAGDSYIFIIEQKYRNCWVKIDVTCTDGEFMLIGR